MEGLAGQDLEEVEAESDETGQDGSKGKPSRQPDIQLVTEHILSTCYVWVRSSSRCGEYSWEQMTRPLNVL